jgi:hypothetical protein
MHEGRSAFRALAKRIERQSKPDKSEQKRALIFDEEV